MGDDDRNEGRKRGECVEHVWETGSVVLARDGAHVERVCWRCGAMLVVGPGELSGRT